MKMMEAYLKKTKLAFVFVVCKFFVLLLTRSVSKIQYVGCSAPLAA